jgi:hypothetical protein
MFISSRPRGDVADLVLAIAVGFAAYFAFALFVLSTHN